jgi:hypothetical protein
MNWKSGEQWDVPRSGLGFLVLPPGANRFKRGGERDGGAGDRLRRSRTNQTLQNHADQSPGNGQGENDEIAAGHTVEGGFKGGERAKHDDYPSVFRARPFVGLELVRSGQCLDNINLNVVKMIFTAFG